MNLTHIRQRVRRIDLYLLVVIVLSLLAFTVKIELLSQRRPFVDPDEGYYLILARNLLTGNGYTFNGLPNVIFPPLLPICIAVIYNLCHDLQTSLSIITALAGSMLGILIFVITCRMVKPIFAVFSSFLVLYAYQMNAFIPTKTHYVDVLYRGSEIFCCCLIFFGIYFSILFVEKKKTIPAMIAGAFFALAYLTRPESLILFLFEVVVLIFLKMTLAKEIRSRHIVLMIISFILFSSSYVIHLKNTTGKWILSGKMSAAQEYRESLLQVIGREDWNSFKNIHYSLNTNTMEMNEIFFGYYKSAGGPERKSLKILIDNAWANLQHYWIIPRSLFSPYTLIFFVIGFFYSVLKIFRTRRSADLILFILLPYSLAVETLSYPIPRHHLFLVPFICIYAGVGVAFLFSRLSESKAKRKRIYGGMILLACLIYMSYEYSANFRKSFFNIPYLKNGLLADEHVIQFIKTKRPQVIMSEQPVFAARAFSDWQVLPNTDIFHVLEFGDHKKVDLIVIRDETRPYCRIIDMKASAKPIHIDKRLRAEILEKNQFFELIKYYND
jgi:4-amino-4-deoxy-L-arabinose transferase-like glycosyltransferase